jgi:putative transposase
MRGTKIVCANLGVRLLHAKPYHAWSKGKVERLIRTIQGDFEATLSLEGGAVHGLAELNGAFSRWIANTYHLRSHGSTGIASAGTLHPRRPSPANGGRSRQNRSALLHPH